MALPTSYSETTFADYLHGLVAELVAGLGWAVVEGSYDEIINDTLIAAEVDDIGTITGRANLARVRALGRLYLWKAVSRAVAGNQFDFEADDGKFTASQVYTQVQRELQTAQTDVDAIWAATAEQASAVTYTVSIAAVRRPGDPYLPRKAS